MVGTICEALATVSIYLVMSIPQAIPGFVIWLSSRLCGRKWLEFSPETYRSGEPDRNRELLLLGEWLAPFFYLLADGVTI
jgi:hypothetical protein